MPTQPSYRVLVTDYVWPNLDIEEQVLGEVGAELMVARRGDEDELRSLAPEADAILTCFRQVSGDTIRAATRCLTIARYGVGVDNIDVDVATAEGIVVTNVPDYCVDEVSDHAMALLLCAARRVTIYDRSVRAGEWSAEVGMPIPRIRGLTLGIVGLGRIGQAVARKASVFGLRLLAYDPYPPSDDEIMQMVNLVDLDTLLRESDFVTVHAPLTPETEGLIGEVSLHKMKTTAWLVNTSRGGLVDTTALCKGIQEGWLAGAALDVLPNEPPEEDDPLRSLPNVILTPHVSFYSEGSLAELERRAAEHAAQVLRGDIPTNVVNTGVLEQANCRLRRWTA